MILTTQQSALTQKLRQNASCLQLGGMINRLYAVMTTFAQLLNICSSNLRDTNIFEMTTNLDLHRNANMTFHAVFSNLERF